MVIRRARNEASFLPRQASARVGNPQDRSHCTTRCTSVESGSSISTLRILSSLIEKGGGPGPLWLPDPTRPACVRWTPHTHRALLDSFQSRQQFEHGLPKHDYDQIARLKSMPPTSIIRPSRVTIRKHAGPRSRGFDPSHRVPETFYTACPVKYLAPRQIHPPKPKQTPLIPSAQQQPPPSPPLPSAREPPNPPPPPSTPAHTTPSIPPAHQTQHVSIPALNPFPALQPAVVPKNEKPFSDQGPDVADDRAGRTYHPRSTLVAGTSSESLIDATASVSQRGPRAQTTPRRLRSRGEWSRGAAMWRAVREAGEREMRLELWDGSCVLETFARWRML